MGFNGWIFATVFALAGMAANAQSIEQNNEQNLEGCIAQADMADIARSFPQFNGLANREYCYDNSETAHLLKGIMFMRETRWAQEMPKSADELFSGRFATSWWQYFIGRINEFSVERSCQKGVVAYVYMWGNTMYVCPAALTSSFSSLDLASVFMHEARHIDGFPHMTCRSGPRAGLSGACDRRISEGGSYGVTVETYAQIAKYAPDIHPALRAYSKSSAVIYADEAFDTPVRIDRGTELLVMTNDKKLHRVAQSGEWTPAGEAQALGHIARRALHLVLYPTDKTVASGFVFADDVGTIPQTAGDVSAEYNSLNPGQRADWIDVHIAAQWHAKVKRGQVLFGCDMRSNNLQTVSTNGEIPRAIFYPNGYDRVSRTVSLAMESGKIFEMGCNGSSAVLRDTGTQYDRPFARMHKFGSYVVGLGLDGKLYTVNGLTSMHLDSPQDGNIHEIVTTEGFNFFDN